MEAALLTTILIQFWSEIVCVSGSLPAARPKPTAKMDVLLTTEAILLVLNSSTEAVVQVSPGGTLLPATDRTATKYDQLLQELENVSTDISPDKEVDFKNNGGQGPISAKRRNVSSNRTIPEKVLPTSSSTTSTSTTTPTTTTTRKHIYIRGHLLTRKHQRTFHPADTHRDDDQSQTPPNIHRAFIQDFRSHSEHQRRVGLDPESALKRSKHGDESKKKKDKFYNYKLLYDTIKTQSDSRHQETEFYAWIFGAAMLTLGSLTTLTACFAFCFCGEKWRKRRQRRRYDKSGEYQRVDSVSSIVDNTTGQLDPILEEQIDSVTII